MDGELHPANSHMCGALPHLERISVNIDEQLRINGFVCGVVTSRDRNGYTM